MSSQRRSSVSQRQQTQPKTFKLSVKALLSLPYRLCNPPPAIGKVRSCAVTPVFKVRLEDVLNRKHLPPLGLKDFEEWLLYVEQCPENLYFILWLKEYIRRYDQWALESKPRRPSICPSSMSYRVAWPTAPTSSSLALFYARAKQTFFTPNRSSPYELNISSDILSPFHTSNLGSPHPDPAVFAEVAVEVQNMLKDSLDRMVVAAYTNVGTNRGLCGILGGCFFMLIGSITPLLVNFLNGRDRWLRLLAIPGMWLGLTILLASLHGVCLMVYIFGDLRQLRKFELSRPPISRPQALSNPRYRPIISPPISLPSSGPVVQPPILQISQPIVHYGTPPQPQPPRLSLPLPPPPAVVHESLRARSLSSSSTGSSIYSCSLSGSESASSSSPSEGHNTAALTIEIGPAFYDSAHIEGPATRSPSSVRYHGSPSKQSLESKNGLSVAEFTPTASFIYPYDPLCDDDYDSTRELSPEERQGLGRFDFDLLPKRGYTFPPRDRAVSVITNTTTEAPSMIEKTGTDVLVALSSPKDIVGRVQYKCNKQESSSDPEKISSHTRSTTASPSSHRAPVDPTAQFKAIKAVPAFASPFTRVLNPVVTRAQWEIVVRSAAVAGMICWTIVGCLLAIPGGR